MVNMVSNTSPLPKVSTSFTACPPFFPNAPDMLFFSFYLRAPVYVYYQSKLSNARTATRRSVSFEMQQLLGEGCSDFHSLPDMPWYSNFQIENHNKAILT